MTKAGKRTRLGLENAPHGHVVRGDGGIADMIEFSEYRSNSSAPTVYVNKIGGIYRVDRSLIKVTFVTGTPGPGGAFSLIEAVNLLWEPSRWIEAGESFRWAMVEFNKGTFHGAVTDDGGGRRPRTQ